MANAMDILKSARRVDSTVWTLGIAGVVALAISAAVNWSPARKPSYAGVAKVETPAASAVTQGASGPATPPAASQMKPMAQAVAPLPAPGAQAPASGRWAASATGRIEPRDGELRIPALLPGRIAEVAVKVNDRVQKGDMLVRIDDEDALLKMAAAASEADVRKRERDEEDAKGLSLDRRRAEDALYDAEQALFKVRMAFDAAGANQRAGRATADEVANARNKIAPAEQRASQLRADLARLNANGGMPLPTRLESAVAVARSEVASAQLMIEKMHVRAPYDGTVLSLPAKVGEYAAPSPDAPLLVFGDLSGLRVRAEVEERDAPRVRVGQAVVIRCDAYPDQDFPGRVTSVGKSLGGARIAVRGPRRPNDIEVLEVQAALDGNPPLITGMRVDVFFKNDEAAEKR